MALFESQKPRQRKGVWYDLLKLELGKHWRGWVSGPAVGVECHYVEGARRACRRLFTADQLTCAYCAEAIEARFTGYVPLWSEDGRRMLLIMGERYWDCIREQTHNTAVKALKTRTRGQAIFCGPSAWTTGHPPILPADAGPQDITPVLLTLWGDESLREWCRAKALERAAAAPPAAPAKPPRRKAVAAPTIGPAIVRRVPTDFELRHRENVTAAEMFPSLAAAAARLQKAELNGHHDPKKPK